MTRRIPTREFALYRLSESGPALAACPLPFSAAQYSRYKYGSVAATEAFAQALGAAFAERHPELAFAPRLLMTSSPYTYVPTAATTLARRLQPVLNAARARRGLPRTPLVQVDRVTPSAGDYGMLSASAREGRMAANTLSFGRFPAAWVCDAHLLIVDDVRVTGAHQRCLMRASDELPLAARAFLYLASFGSAAGDLDPTQEDVLNHAVVRSLDDLAGIIATGDFAWNVRVCKFVLDPAQRDGLARFLARMPGWFVHDLHRNSRRDGYALMRRYAPSHAVVDADLAGRPAGALAAGPARQPVS